MKYDCFESALSFAYLVLTFTFGCTIKVGTGSLDGFGVHLSASLSALHVLNSAQIVRIIYFHTLVDLSLALFQW